MQEITTSQIFGLVPGGDFEIERTYDLDENVDITTAILSIKTLIDTPPGTPKPGPLIPIYLTINSSDSVYGKITDDSEGDATCVLTFLLPGALTLNALDSYTMYFFAIQLITGDETPQKYQPESGAIITSRRMIT